jgi:hypothetical protein
MELWQKDITGGVHLADGTQASIVTGLDDKSDPLPTSFAKYRRRRRRLRRRTIQTPDSK